MTTLTTGKATEFINFTRASNATVVDSNGLIKWAAHNLLLASEQFDASNWQKNATTVSSNNIAAPNGTSTADKIVELATTAVHGVQFSLSTIFGDLTLAVFAKAGERNWMAINYANLANGAVWFDLTNGVLGTKQSAVTAATITSMGNGWYLCTARYNTTGGGYDPSFLVASADNTFSYAGNAANGLYLWGAHLYRSDLGGMQANTSAYPMYNPTTPKNLLGFTESFDNAAWTKTQTTVTGGVVAPNGLSTAFKLEAASGAGGGQQVFQASTVVGSGPYVYSVYAKLGSGATDSNKFVIYNNTTATTYAAITIDYSTGIVTQSIGSGASATNVGNGWWRIAIPFASTATVGNSVRVYIGSTGTVETPGEFIYAWGAQLSDSASLDSYSPVYGAAVTSAAYYGPRRDFDPVTLACKGLLVEEQRTNALQYSEEFTNAYWIRSLAPTITADTAISPSGAQTADTIAVSGGVFSGVYKHITSTNGTTYTSSVYVKAGTLSYVCILVDAGSSAAWFNLSNGTKGSTAGTIASYNIVPVGNGWYRVWVTFVANSTANATLWIAPTSADNINNGTGSVYAWGAQIEQASFATSYIPTGAATATRLADVASVSTQAFPYSATEGTLVAFASSALLPSAYTNGRVACLNDATSNNVIELYISQNASDTVNAAGRVMLGGVQQTNPTKVITNNADPHKIALAYKASDFAVTGDGLTPTTTASGAVPSAITRMQLGALLGGNYVNGHIRQITYIPRRLANAELQTRTA